MLSTSTKCSTDYDKTPFDFAGFYIYNSVSQKAIYTNNGINFFLYVISGKKFRTDLVNLFRRRRDGMTSDDQGSGSSASMATAASAVTST